jgi:hypothetical protein
MWEDEDDLKGPAAIFLRGNDYAKALVRFARADQKAKCGVGYHRNQIVAALMGRHHQCRDCGRYFETRKLMLRHGDRCLQDDYVWRYDYIKTNRGRYFCYFDCPQATFYTVLGLERHLLEHPKEALFKWGISKEHLVKRTEQALERKNRKPHDD